MLPNVPSQVLNKRVNICYNLLSKFIAVKESADTEQNLIMQFLNAIMKAESTKSERLARQTLEI